MATLEISFRSGDVERVKFGAFAQIAAKRRFGLDVIRTEDPEPVLFGAFVELNGPAAAKDPDAFDAWLMTVDAFRLVPAEADDENPPTAETRSDLSPGSPPTSDSTPSP